MLVSICEDDQRNRGEIEALCREWGVLHQDCPLTVHAYETPEILLTVETAKQWNTISGED